MGAASTWGISGPVFLVVYGVIAVAVWIASTRARRVLADPVPEQSAENLSGHPHDVAYLNGGAELAVTSALSSMHVRGTIATTKGEVRAAGRLGTDAEDLERALHFVTGSGAVPRTRLSFHRPVTAALGAIEARLVTAGLLLSDGQRRRIRRVGFRMLAVAGLGLVRLLAGIAAAQPVGLLVVALLGVTVVAAVQLARAPRRSRTGDHALAALRTDCKLIAESLAPAVPPGASRTWRRARRPSERPWSASTSRSSAPADARWATCSRCHAVARRSSTSPRTSGAPRPSWTSRSRWSRSPPCSTGPTTSTPSPTSSPSCWSAPGALLLLDVANIHANALNRGQDARDVLDRMPLDRIAYVHVAGGAEHDGLYHDTHTDPVPEPVLSLLERLVERSPTTPPVMLERDGRYPPAADLAAELDAMATAAHLPTPTRESGSACARVGVCMRASRGLHARESGSACDLEESANGRREAGRSAAAGRPTGPSGLGARQAELRRRPARRHPPSPPAQTGPRGRPDVAAAGGVPRRGLAGGLRPPPRRPPAGRGTARRMGHRPRPARPHGARPGCRRRARRTGGHPALRWPERPAAPRSRAVPTAARLASPPPLTRPAGRSDAARTPAIAAQGPNPACGRNDRPSRPGQPP